jgi:hypothetical protein
VTAPPGSASLDVPSLSGWYVGYAIGGVTITLVVVLVGLIITRARQIAVQAEVIAATLERARANSVSLHSLPVVNTALLSIVSSATAARGVLEGKL